MKRTPKWSRLIPLAVAFTACQNNTVDPAASVAPADTPRASFDARADSSKFVPAPGEKVPNSYILKTHTDKDARAVAQQLTAEHTATVKYVYPSLPGLAVTLPNPDDLPKPPDLSKLLEDRRIVRVSEERILQVADAGPPRDLSLDTQTGIGWNLDKLDSRTFATDGNYRYEETASSAPVYVIDSGISPHREFGSRLLPGADVTGALLSDGRFDKDGHGTAVASIIGGNTTGVAKTVKLIPVRIMRTRESFEESGLLAGIEWVIDHNTGFAVANLSVADADGDDDIDEMVRRLVADGVTAVVSAGNSDNDACEVSPARLTEAITVSAVNSSGTRSVFDNEEQPAASYGTCVDIWAPGSNVKALRSETGEVALAPGGTSLAGPHVAAVAWLILREENNQASPAHIKDVIRSSATEGRLNVNGPNKFLYAPRSAAWISGPSSVTSSGSRTWAGKGWGGYSLTYRWETSTDGGTTWTAAGTTDRYTRSFNSSDDYTLTLRLTVTNDFDEQPSVTWTIPVDTGCGGTVCPG